MMIFRIAAHEFRYMLWSVQSLVAFAALFGFAFLFTADGTEFQVAAGGGNILINAPTMITFFLLMSGVAATFFVPSYMASAILKDENSRFDAILFATPITKNDYILGRFLGAFTALALVMTAGPVGMLLGTFWPWADPATLSPTYISHYITSFFGFLMPSMFLVSGLVFAVAVMSRSMLYCYVAVLGLFIFYIAAQGSGTVSPLWDPFMVQAFNEQIRYWTAAELNQNLISYSGVVFANRLVWLAIAFILFAVAYLRFSFRVPAKLPSVRRKKKPAKPVLQENKGYRSIANWSRGTHFRQFLLCTKFEVEAVIKSQPFMLLMGFSLFLLVLTFSNRAVLYEVNALPVTRILIAGMVEALIWALLAVTAFYGADVVWRDRESKFNEFLDAAPAPNWVYVLSKVAALVTIVFSTVGLGIGAALGTQIANGYFDFEIGLYLEQGLLFGISFVFLAILSCFLQVLVKSRFLGIMMMGLYWAVTIGSVGVLEVEHPLARYAMGSISTPLSDMNGSGRFIEAGLWIRVYYGSVAGLLVMLTYVLWNRGTLQPLRYRLKNLRVFRRARFAAPLAIILTVFVGSGSYVFYNTNILNDYRTRTDTVNRQIAYEQQFRQYQKLPMPRTVDIKLQVDIFPYGGRVETRGTHILENKTNTDINVVHVVFPPGLAAMPIARLEGARLASADEVFRYFIFELEKPMLSGEQRTLAFETLIHNKGFSHRGGDVTLVRNGTYFDNDRITPHIGFNSEFLIKDRNKRRKAGLATLPRTPKLEDTHQYQTNGLRSDSDFVGLEVTISTVADQIAVTSGYLQKEWHQNGRRFFTYKMDAPILNVYGFLSAEYETVRDHSNGVDLEIFYHKPHHRNLGRMMEGAKDSLAYFSDAFGPYQFKQLRILEFPGYRVQAKSFPNTIAYSEDIGFLADISDASLIDVPYYVTAHEVAHQWWAHQVTPANTQGSAMLSEALSQYSALMVMERKYGKDQIRKFLKFELDDYLSGRDNDPEGEVPLLRAEGQQYIHYRKGAVILYALKDYLGENVVNRALQRLVKGHAFSSVPYATSADLLVYLKQEAGPEHESLITDFLEKITLFDVRVKNSNVFQMADGRFKVTLKVEANKYYSDAIGNQTAATFDIPVDIGLFLENPGAIGFEAADVIMLEKRVVADGKSDIVIVVDQKPIMAGIDPYNKLIDRNSEDNLLAVDELKAPAVPGTSGTQSKRHAVQ